jgi:CheY-like chemotaxis protein
MALAKILIVEDDDVLSKMYQKKFDISGYETQIAGNGEEGLAKMRAFAPDLVLMDVMMPKMDGFTALDHAKHDPALKHIPIVILTNLSTVQDSAAADKKGAVAHIVKSDLTPAQVVERVKEILANIHKNLTV